MAYGRKYYYLISSVPYPALGAISKSWRVSFFYDGWGGGATEVTAAAQSTVLSYADSSDEITAPIKTKVLTMQMVSTDDLDLNNFVTQTDRDIYVEIDERIGEGAYTNSPIFRGWVSAFDSEEPFLCKPYTFQIKAYCGLASLRDFDYVGIGLKTFNEAIAYCLSKTGFSLNYTIGIDTRIDGDEGDPTKLYAHYSDRLNELNCYEALSLILEAFVAEIEQVNCEWLIRGVSEQVGDTLNVYRYNSAGAAIGETNPMIVNYGITIGRTQARRNIRGATTRINAALSAVEITYELGDTRNLLLNGDFAQAQQVTLPIVGTVWIFDNWTKYDLVHDAYPYSGQGGGIKIEGRIKMVDSSSLDLFGGPKRDAKYVTSDPVDISGANTITISGKFVPFEVDFGHIELWIVDPDNPTYKLWMDGEGNWHESKQVIGLDYKASVVRFFGDNPPPPSSYPFEIKSAAIPARRMPTAGTTTAYTNIRYQEAYLRVFRGIYNNVTPQVPNPTGPYIVYQDLFLSQEARSVDKYKLLYGFKNANYVRKNKKSYDIGFGGYSIQLSEILSRQREAYLKSYASVILSADGEQLVDAWTKYGNDIAYDFIKLNGISRLRLGAYPTTIWEGDIVGLECASHNLYKFSALSGKKFKPTSYEYDFETSIARVTLYELIGGNFSYTEEVEEKSESATGKVIVQSTAPSSAQQIIGTPNKRVGVEEGGGGGGGTTSFPQEWSQVEQTNNLAAYTNKGALSAPFDFRQIDQNGDWQVNLETWEGCDFAPAELASQGKLQSFIGGGTKKLIYTDVSGFVAEWTEVDGQEVTENMWVYLATQEFGEFDQQGRQLIPAVGRIEKGKIVEITQKTVYKGVESMGVFGGTSVLEAIPILQEGQTLHAIDGIYNWQIADWNAITDKPSNLSGPGFLNVTFFGGFVHLNAFAYADLSSAFAIRQNLGAALSPWQLSTVGEYYNKTTIDYLLGFYSQVGHNHDDRYYLISEVNRLLENYRLNTWLPNIEDVSGLSISLANKVDVGLFLNGIIGGALVVGEDKQPTIVDLDDPYIDAAILVNAKVGQAYGQSVAASGIFAAYTGYKIDETQIVWPRGALNKRIVPISAQPWIGFEFHQSNGSIGSSYDGQGFIIKGNSTPTVSGEASILVDMIHTTTPNGRPRREQRVLLIRVDPADAVITTPSTPTPAVATAASVSQINIVWADVSGEAGYEIWSSNAADGHFTRIGSTGPNQTSFQHLNLEPNTDYYYKINAYNSAGSSGFADANATTLAGSVPVTGGLYARYYPSTTLDTATSVNRVDQVIDFNLVDTDPIAGVAYGAFSVRWSGKIKSPVSGNIGFQFNSNAGIRIWVGGQPVVDNWVDRTVLQANQFSVSMVANTDYDIIIEYYQINNTARAHLQYRNGTTYEVVPTTWLTPVALLGAPIPAPVLTASPEGSDTVNLAWTYAGSADYFEVSGGTSNTTFPVLNNHVPLGAAREEIIGGLPSSTTFYFRIRAYTAGRYSPYSNIATAATAAPAELPNAPVPVSLTRIIPGDLSGTNLEVRFTDTNVGSEQYEIRFREYGTTQWFTLVAGFQLSPNASNPLLLSYNTLNIVQSVNNSTFQGKRMEVAVRVVKSATLKSAWVSAIEAPADSGSGDPVDPNTEVQIIEYEDFVVVRNADGTYSDTKPRTVGDEFHAFYLCDDDYDIDFYNADGTPRAFQNITLDADSVYVFRKLMLRKSVYPTLQSWKENAWWSNIGQQESNMLYSAQAVVRTYGTPSQEVVVRAPNPIIVTRVGAGDIDITILIAGRTEGRSYEINYRVVGTSTWYVFASDFSLKPFPATANLVQEPLDATTNIVLIFEDRELFTQGRIEVRARAYENGKVSAWSSVYAEPANSDKLDLSLLLLDWGGSWGNDEIMWSDSSYHNGYWYASPASAVPTGLTVSSWPKIQGAADYAAAKKLKSIVMPVFWDRCNPAEGVYIFQQIRFAVLYNASKGLKTHFFVDATRRWTADPAFRTASDWTFNLEDAEIDEHGNLHGEPFNHIPALGSDKWNNWFIFVRALAEALADLSEHIGWYAGSSNPTKEWGTLFNENSTSHPDTIAMYQAWHNMRYGTTPSAIAKVSDPNSTNKQRTGKFHSLRMIELWESATEEIKAANPNFKTVYHMSSATNQTFKRTCLTVPANLPSIIDGMKSNPARAFDPSFAIRAVARPGKLAIVEYAYDEVEYAGVHPGVAGYEIANKVKIAFDNGATGAVLAFFENAYANIGGPADVCLTALVESLESAGYLDTTYYYYTGNPDIINMSAVVAMANDNGDYEQAYLAQFNASKDARFQQLPAINYVDDI